MPSRGAADGKVEGLSGYPLFSAPPEVADALAWTGCDGCSTASNHSIDQGFSGLVETLEVLETAGLGQAGTAATEEGSKQTTLYDVDGVSVAHFAATWWLNGLQLPAEAPWSVDLDVDRILSQGATARAAGADFVVVSIHCCVEYRALPTSYQVAIGEALIASPDVDLVVGHHAHVVQPIDVVDGEFIVYGLGNFLSGQQWSPETTDGVLVTAEIAPRREGWWSTRAIHFTPTWVEGGSYRIIPAAEAIAAGWPSPSLTAALTASWRPTASIIRLFDPPMVEPSAYP